MLYIRGFVALNLICSLGIVFVTTKLKVAVELPLTEKAAFLDPDTTVQLEREANEEDWKIKLFTPSIEK
jgi:hypothetical protein